METKQLKLVETPQLYNVIILNNAEQTDKLFGL